jgi:N-acetylmuramoyl-L-alanine amidase
MSSQLGWSHWGWLFLLSYSLIVSAAGSASPQRRVKRLKPPVVRSLPQRFAPIPPPKQKVLLKIPPIIVAIDAGHGGKDPGAIGPTGLQEKQVTLAISQRLATLLKKDPHFIPVLIRSRDQFIPVGERSTLAREQRAQLLISIHADGAVNRQARGASIWVLSNQRAHREVGRWLTQPKPQLLGGAAPLLAQPRDSHLHHALLDLQFGYSQQVGQQVASAVLQELAKVVPLHKQEPEYASLGVLQSPDIPSLLIESGFITHRDEERLLKRPQHQQQIANAVYRGIQCYFQAAQRVQPAAPQKNIALAKAPAAAHSPAHAPQTHTASQPTLHVVQRGESLFSIATRHGLSWRTLLHHNRLNSSQLQVGQKIELPLSTRLVKQLH